MARNGSRTITIADEKRYGAHFAYCGFRVRLSRSMLDGGSRIKSNESRWTGCALTATTERSHRPSPGSSGNNDGSP